MIKLRSAVLSCGLGVAFLGASAAHGGNFIVYPLTGDEDSGIDAARTYTHLYDLASADGGAVVNGVTVPAGTTSGSNYTLTGTNQTFPNSGAGQGNNLPPGSGVFDLAEDFYYTSGIGTGTQSLQLTGLTPGQRYTTSFYTAGFGGAIQVITPDDDTAVALATDRGDANRPAGQEKRITYTYTAPASGQITYTFDPVNDADAFHHLGFANESTNLVPVPGFFNTGVASANQPNGSNTTTVPSGTAAANFTVLVPGAADYVATRAATDQTAYFNGGTDSTFVNDRGSATVNEAPGTYIYRTTFDLTGFDPESAVVGGQFLVDDNVTDILINGVSTGITGTGFTLGQIRDFAITDGFIAGQNTLEFVVLNGGTDANPTGLRVNLLNGLATPVPEPAGLSLLALGGAALLGRRRRRQR